MMQIQLSSLNLVNEAQVQKKIKELKNGKSTGLDGISVKLLRASAS